MAPRLAAIVLAGGASRRMGAPKAGLDWHGSPLLHRTTSLLLRVADPVVVVAAPGQWLPALPAGVRRADDAQPGRGPLEGMAAGLQAVRGRATAAFIASADLPLLHPDFVASVAGALSGYEVAVPVVAGRAHPLAAAYRVDVLGRVRELLAGGRLRVAFLVERCRVHWLTRGQLTHPESVRNVNTPAQLAAARALAAPLVTVERAAGTAGDRDRPAEVTAATLGAALRALGCAAAGLHVVLNGRQVPADPQLALAAGDRLRVHVGPGVLSAGEDRSR